jgi:hypothetical protein
MNGAAGLFSRMRRAEIGHHHVAGACLVGYAQEWWRCDLMNDFNRVLVILA